MLKFNNSGHGKGDLARENESVILGTERRGVVTGQEVVNENIVSAVEREKVGENTRNDIEKAAAVSDAIVIETESARSGRENIGAVVIKYRFNNTL